MATIPVKAYNNLEFLNSAAARTIRILCEYEETRQRFLRHGIRHTIVFFGSARVRSSDDTTNRLAGVQELVKHHPDDPVHQEQLRRAQMDCKLAIYYDAARELSRRLTAWSVERENGPRDYCICTGGGPGTMAAANRGASDVPGGRSVGLGISLPFEQGVNEWVTEGLAFEFHYFFTRKLWFLYLCKAMVCFPGGFGTMDELFETLTLLQTKKISKRLPVVLFGKAYWNKILNLEGMAEFGTISPEDPKLAFRTDSVDEAFDYLTSTLIEIEEELGDKADKTDMCDQAFVPEVDDPVDLG